MRRLERQWNGEAAISKAFSCKGCAMRLEAGQRYSLDQKGYAMEWLREEKKRKGDTN